MKTLTVLLLAQLALLVLLLVKVVSLDNALPETMAEQHATIAEQPVAPSNSTLSMPESGSHVTSAPFPEDRLREIIREELAAQLKSIAGSQTDAAPAPSPVDDTEFQYRRELVAQRLQYYASVGQITRQEMDELQGQIAALKEEDRQAMFRELVGALNTGAIDGRL